MRRVVVGAPHRSQVSTSPQLSRRKKAQQRSAARTIAADTIAGPFRQSSTRSKHVCSRPCSQFGTYILLLHRAPPLQSSLQAAELGSTSKLHVARETQQLLSNTSSPSNQRSGFHRSQFARRRSGDIVQPEVRNARTLADFLALPRRTSTPLRFQIIKQLTSSCRNIALAAL